MKTLLIVLAVACGLGSQWVTAQAADNSDLAHAVRTAPVGLPLDKLLTTQAPQNSAELLDSPSMAKSIALITRDQPATATGQAGSVWSQDGSQNSVQAKLNLKQDKKIGLWLYFGDKGQAAADGLAFVLHNAPQQAGAQSHAGQSLGVWGTDKTPLVTEPLAVAQSAIQNSWALEFDTHVNRTPLPGMHGFFDGDPTVPNGMHVDHGYPGTAGSYVRLGAAQQHYYGLKPTQPRPVSNLADGRWHHLTVKWQAKESVLVYQLNDKDVAGNFQSKDDYLAGQVRVDQQQFAVNGSVPNSVFWGVTGATSAAGSENGLVVVDQLSDTPKFDKLTAVVRDVTGLHSMEEGGRLLRAGDKIDPGHRVRYTFRARYTGKTELAGVKIDVPLPKEVKWRRAKVALQMSDDLFFEEPTLQGDRFQYQLKQSMTANVPHARNTILVSIEGTVRPTSRMVRMPSVIGNFYGPDYRIPSATIPYLINGQSDLQVANLGKSEMHAVADKHALIAGRLTNGGDPLTHEEWEDSHVKVTLNNRVVTQPQVTQARQPGSQPGDFHVTIPHDSLKLGRNVVTISADDGYGNVTRRPFSVHVIKQAGQLQFTQLPKDSTFKATQLTGDRQLIRRHLNWGLKVRDTRDAGRSWKLAVRVSEPFATTDQRQLSGNLAWVQKKQTTHIKAGEAFPIPASPKGQEELDVTRSWGADEGLMLNVNSDAVAGEYAGQLTWELYDAP